MLNLAYIYEQSTPWKDRHPALYRRLGHSHVWSKAAVRGTARRAPHRVERFGVGWMIERTMDCNPVVVATRHLFTG
jgi:hypothetical protein